LRAQDTEVSQTERLYRLKHLRDRMNAPIAFDRERSGRRLDRSQSVITPQYELPGLQLSAEETHALLTMSHPKQEGQFEADGSYRVKTASPPARAGDGMAREAGTGVG
jgi:hypothetical protein